MVAAPSERARDGGTGREVSAGLPPGAWGIIRMRATHRLLGLMPAIPRRARWSASRQTGVSGSAAALAQAVTSRKQHRAQVARTLPPGNGGQ